MTATPYRPVDCALHDVLEASAVRGTICHIRYESDARTDSVTELTARIRDVYAEDGAEYLLLDEGTTIRLDRLVDVRPTTDPA